MSVNLVWMFGWIKTNDDEDTHVHMVLVVLHVSL